MHMLLGLGTRLKSEAPKVGSRHTSVEPLQCNKERLLMLTSPHFSSLALVSAALFSCVLDVVGQKKLQGVTSLSCIQVS